MFRLLQLVPNYSWCCPFPKKAQRQSKRKKDSFIKKYFCPLNKKFYGICIQKNGN